MPDLIFGYHHARYGSAAPAGDPSPGYSDPVLTAGGPKQAYGLGWGHGLHPQALQCAHRKAKIRNHLELKRYKDILKRDSRIDGLTRIPNRRRFDEAYAEERERARRNKMPLSVLMIDLDRFKAYNDTYGHLQGDDVLKLVAKTLYHALRRPGDLVARWGGEEFSVLLPQTDLLGALHVAERLRSAVYDLEIPHESSHVADVLTVSIGVASSMPNQPWSYDQLLQWADEAVYRAKAEGRNRVVAYEYARDLSN